MTTPRTTCTVVTQALRVAAVAAFIAGAGELTAGAAGAAGSAGAAGTAGHVERAATRSARALQQSAIQIRSVVQQGLAVALASNVLQSQVEVLIDDQLGSTSCGQLALGVGSAKVIDRSVTAAGTSIHIDFYYGAGCTEPYIEAAAHITTSHDNFAVTESASYLSPAGSPLGVLRLSETAAIGSSAVGVHGTGTFTPADGASPVSLGLSCSIPTSADTPPPFVCDGGVAQYFPSLHLSAGSLTPITLTLASSGENSFRVGFVAPKATIMDSSGALTIDAPTPSTLSVAGKGHPVLSDSITGRAGAFSLFPPTPTGWSVTGSGGGPVFTIAVTNDTTRSLVGTVRSSSGKSLATLSLDKSGSGTISYASGKHARVENWTLGN